MSEEASGAQSSEVEAIRRRFGEQIVEANEICGELQLQVKPEAVLAVARYLRDKGDYDHPSDLLAYDTGSDLVVIYRLWSLQRKRSVIMRVHLNRDEPKVASVTSIWPGTDWHERECYDLFGIVFEGHPNLKRILLPDDWEGWPFRKDYHPIFSGDPLHGPQETN